MNENKKNNRWQGGSSAASPGGFNALVAFIGAAVYFINQASGFGEVVVAFLKAIIWPGYLVYHLLGSLQV